MSRAPAGALPRHSDAQSGLLRSILPSWAASIWFHALLLIVASYGLRSCTGTGQRGEANADWRAVGLVTRMAASDQGSEAPPGEPAPAEPAPSLDASQLPASDVASAATPPVDLPDLPGSEMPAVIGPGAGVPQFSPANPASENRAPAGGDAPGPVAPSGLARGETDFFGIRDKGQTFVYVLDASGSMSEPEGKPIAAARQELMASLETLGTDQQFQVIFYSERPQVMRLPGKAPEKLYWASDINRTLARQIIGTIQPDAGTDHMKALKAALEIAPDVIFFLTDADDPALSAKDLDLIRRLNSRTRIHAVEFGKGARLSAASSLERLARQNRGAYEYRDVTRFRR